MAVKGKAEPQATRNVAAAPCLWLAELMGSEIIQCWKVRSSTTAGAEVETNQGRNWSCGKWYCFKIINKTLFHLLVFSNILFCMADLKEWKNNT